MHIRNLLIPGALAAATLIGTASGANAATYNADGTGFIGKGEVQSAFAMKNADLQKAVDGKGFAFRTEQAASQALTQRLSQSAEQDGIEYGTESGTQTVSQYAEQTVTQTLSCEKTTGQTEQRWREGTRSATRTDTRSTTRTAERDAERAGIRTGVRYGSRNGTLAGTLNATIDAKARQTGQWTGWNVKSTAYAPHVPTAGSESFDVLPASLTGNYGFGDWAPDGDWAGTGDWGNFGEYDLGAYDWAAPTFSGDFIADEPNEDPNGICVVGKNNVIKVTLDTTYGAVDEDPEVFEDPVSTGFIADDNGIAEGAITDGKVEVVTSPDSISYGAWSASGPIKTFAKNLNTTGVGAGMERQIG